MKNSKNPKGAGRKPLEYKTKQIRVPEPIILEIQAFIKKWKESKK